MRWIVPILALILASCNASGPKTLPSGKVADTPSGKPFVATNGQTYRVSSVQSVFNPKTGFSAVLVQKPGLNAGESVQIKAELEAVALEWATKEVCRKIPGFSEAFENKPGSSVIVSRYGNLQMFTKCR